MADVFWLFVLNVIARCREGLMVSREARGEIIPTCDQKRERWL